MLKKAWFILITLCFAQISFAQRDLIRFNNITIDNGLIQGSISGVVHGKDGFIWIATADGLHRYDGYNFKIYRNDPSQPNSLPDNYISCIYEDNSGKLLVGLYNGEVCILNNSIYTVAKPMKRLNR
jgi:ligand-binding sensor domain-containing protein